MRHRPYRSTILVALLAASACGDELRGKALASADGQTYLAVVDDNGGRCSPIKVDGVVWAAPIGTLAPIAPGTHAISCGDDAKLEFTVRPGTTFHFNYWGP